MSGVGFKLVECWTLVGVLLCRERIKEHKKGEENTPSIQEHKKGEENTPSIQEHKKGEDNTPSIQEHKKGEDNTSLLQENKKTNKVPPCKIKKSTCAGFG